jgi:hypothetical protein
MAGTLLRRLLPVCLAALAVTSVAAACPFCSMQGETLTGDVKQASMVLFGTLTNAKLDPSGGFGEGTTDLVIEAVIKKHDILGNKKVLTLAKYVPVDQNNSAKFLILCDVFNGKIDPYRGVAVKADSDMVKYLTGALAVKDKDVATRLRFFFDYLDNPDVEIANDSYKEFGNADYKDFRDMAKELPADKVAKWLADADTPAFRYGLYASMLGHCGTAKHAELLRQMLDDPQKRLNSGIDGVLAGYTMLQPKEGWAYIRAILKDESKEFLFRYAALRAARFFWDYRPDLIDKKTVVEAVCLLLDHKEMADLAIEDLRKWGHWDVLDRVLALYSKPSHDIPIVRRAILRYALSCPKSSKAEAFVAELRKKAPDMVQDVEELLKLETPAPPIK